MKPLTRDEFDAWLTEVDYEDTDVFQYDDRGNLDERHIYKYQDQYYAVEFMNKEPYDDYDGMITPTEVEQVTKTTIEWDYVKKE